MDESKQPKSKGSEYTEPKEPAKKEPINQEQFMLKVGQKADNGFICVAHVNLLVRPSKTNSKKADLQPEYVISQGANLNDVGEFYIQFGKQLKKLYSKAKQEAMKESK